MGTRLHSGVRSPTRRRPDRAPDAVRSNARTMLTAPSGPSPDADLEDRRLATAELALGGMHCGACASRIEGALAERAGVVSASVNLATTRAFVAYDPATVGVQELCGAVDGVGYSATPVDADDDASAGGTFRPLGPAGRDLVAAGPGRLRHRPGRSHWWERGRRLDRPHPGRGRRAGRRLALPADDGPFVAPGGDEHGHPHRPGDAGRPGRERGGGHRPPRAALPPRRWRRVRRPPARRDGAAHRGHPGHRPRHRGPGPPTGRRCHALAARAATPDGTGRVRTRRR